jgi:hypothetical protein
MKQIEWLESVKFDAGWVDDPTNVAEAVSGFNYATFNDTPAGQLKLGDLPREVALWRDCQRFTGKATLPVTNQGNAGFCVGFGTCRAIEYTNLWEIAYGDAETFRPLSRGVCYAGSRVEANGGKSPWRGDGSTGGSAAKFVTKWGILDEGIYAGYDLTQYNIPMIRDWGLKGVPDALEPLIREHPVSNATMVLNIDEARRALSQGYAITVCSNQGFTTTRDKNGVCYPQGNWAHCTMCSGYCWIGNDLYFFIENSWGNYMGTKNPAPLGANAGTFLCKGDTFSRMLGDRDSYAFSGVKGFMRRNISWDF